MALLWQVCREDETRSAGHVRANSNDLYCLAICININLKCFALLLWSTVAHVTLARVRVRNSIKFGTVWNLLPVLKIGTRILRIHIA